MTTAIDTNVVTALWNNDDALNVRAQAALDGVFGRGRLVVSGVVYAELLAAPARTEEFVDRFLHAAAIDVEWEINERLLRAAGLAFRGYADRRRKQSGAEKNPCGFPGWRTRDAEQLQVTYTGHRNVPRSISAVGVG